MTAINILLEEHNLLLKAAEVTGEVQRIADNELYYRKIRDVILFFRNFSQMYHHPKEENILYPLLRNRSADLSAEFLCEVCDSHDDFKIMMAEIESTYLAYDYDLLRIAIDIYIKGLEEHIKRENEIVLSVAAHLLTEDELRSVLEAFQNHDETCGYKEAMINDFFEIESLNAAV